MKNLDSTTGFETQALRTGGEARNAEKYAATREELALGAYGTENPNSPEVINLEPWTPLDPSPYIVSPHL